MFSVIIILIIILILTGLFTQTSQESISKMEKLKQERCILMGAYIGGCKEIYDAGMTGWMIINKQKIEMFYKEKLQDKSYVIPIENVLEAYLQTEEEIQKQVTLGRLLVFGILAFGLKKTKKMLKKYMVIKFLNIKGEEDTLIYDSKNYSQALEKINEFKNEYENNIRKKIKEDVKSTV